MRQTVRSLQARRLFWGLFAIAATWLVQAEHDPLSSIQTRLLSLYQENKDAVVRVKVATKTTSETGEEKIALTVLSGFFVDDQGTVATNAVPDSENTRLWIEHNGKQYLAIAQGTDRRANLSLIRTVKPPAISSFISIEPTIDDTAIGSLAFAITCPLELDPTPKWGLLNGKESEFADIDFPFIYWRIGIRSGPAEGGSPVFDLDGNLIGISVATIPEIDSSYIVPTRSLQRIAAKLSEGASYQYANVHASFEERSLPSELEPQVVVAKVEPNTQTEAAGLKSGDIVRAINATPVTSIDALRNQIFFSDPGSFIQLSVERGNERKEFGILVE